jgi:hypothetical protein
MNSYKDYKEAILKLLNQRSEGKIVITQKGQVVEPENAKGPIRLKLK